MTTRRDRFPILLRAVLTAAVGILFLLYGSQRRKIAQLEGEIALVYAIIAANTAAPTWTPVPGTPCEASNLGLRCWQEPPRDPQLAGARSFGGMDDIVSLPIVGGPPGESIVGASPFLLEPPRHPAIVEPRQ